MNHINTRLNKVHLDIGITSTSEHASISAQISAAESDIAAAIDAARVKITGVRGYTVEHMVYFIKQSEINQTEFMHELIDRCRHLTLRLEALEFGIGGGTGYGNDVPTELYSSYVTPQIDPT